MSSLSEPDIDVLQCPARSSKKPGTGYVTMAEDLRMFQELGHVPLEIDLRMMRFIRFIRSRTACSYHSSEVEAEGFPNIRISKEETFFSFLRDILVQL